MPSWTSSISPSVGAATKVSEINAAFNNTLWLLANLIPAGAVLPYGGSAAPAGSSWLLCDGSAVSQTTYSALYAVVGTAFNTGGEAAGTFRVPDLRGRAPIGAGTGSGLTARTLGQRVGAETHTLSTAEMPSHSHTYTEITSGGDVQTGATGDYVTGAGTSSTGSAGGDGAHNNMQPSLVCNFIIRTGL